MQGFQGVRNLRDLFLSKYTKKNGDLDNSLRQTQGQSWRIKQMRQKGSSMNNSRELSQDLNTSRLPPFQQKRSIQGSPEQRISDTVQISQIVNRFSMTNQGFYKANGDKPSQIGAVIMEEYLQRGSISRLQQNKSRERVQGQSKSRGISPVSSNNRPNSSKNKVEENVTRNHFVFHYVIGRGGFGKVWKVETRKNKQLFAMKEMQKAKVLAKKSVNSVMNERVLLQTIKHPFLVNMVYAFQDKENLYLIMDLLTGGDLRYHIGRLMRFKENQTKFFIACLILALEYLHSNNIIHRDIKPENLVLDHRGYLRVTDLGIARVLRPENNSDTSGTPGYMAPEVMCRQNHTFAVDYYAMGIIIYEFMLGRRPYIGRSRREIRDQILAKQVQIKRNEIPDGWSVEAADFANRLIQRKPNARLGYNGILEIRQHPWLKDVQWDRVYNKNFEAPFIPKPADDNYDLQLQQQQSEDHETLDEMIRQNQQLLRRNSVQGLFDGYECQIAQVATKSTASSRNSYYQNNSNNTTDGKNL